MKKSTPQEIQDAIFRKMSADDRVRVGAQLWQLGKALAGEKIDYRIHRSEATSHKSLQKQLIFQELETVPGVGKKIAEDLFGLRIRSVKDLKSKDPEKLYEKLCRKEGKKIDRCMLYIFRCAVYYASNTRHNPRLLKWWHWKDDTERGRYRKARSEEEKGVTPRA